MEDASCSLANTELIEASDDVRNLGIIFDSLMATSAHIAGLCKSLSYQLRSMSIFRIRRIFDKH